MANYTGPSTPSVASNLPAGFVSIITSDGHNYIVPDFLVPATHLAFQRYTKRHDRDINKEPGGAANFSEGIPVPHLGAEAITLPADPTFTERELLGLHSDILVLRDTLGLSYKDAAHRLYLAEAEKLSTEEKARKAFAHLTARTSDALLRFQKQLATMHSKVSDNRHNDSAVDADLSALGDKERGVNRGTATDLYQ